MLNESNVPISKDTIKLFLGIDAVALSIISSQNDDIISWGKDKYYLKSKIKIDENSKEDIIKYLSKVNEFLPNDLLAYAQYRKLSFLQDNSITDKYALNSFIKNCPLLFEQFKYIDDGGIYKKQLDEYEKNSEEFEL